MAQALVVDRADVDVGRQLVSCHAADQRLACAQHSLPWTLHLSYKYHPDCRPENFMASYCKVAERCGSVVFPGCVGRTLGSTTAVSDSTGVGARIYHFFASFSARLHTTRWENPFKICRLEGHLLGAVVAHQQPLLTLEQCFSMSTVNKNSWNQSRNDSPPSRLNPASSSTSLATLTSCCVLPTPSASCAGTAHSFDAPQDPAQWPARRPQNAIFKLLKRA